MSATVYYISLPFIYLLSLLPFPVLYLISDGLYFILYYFIGYRRKVVMQNLRNSFPGKSEEELKAVSKKFYKYLCDLFLETFKTLTISKSSMLKHCKFNKEALAVFGRLADEKKSAIIVMGHLGNWEWAGNTFSIQCRQQLYVVYHPLSNKYFNGLMVKMRIRFGTKLIAMRDTFKEMLAKKNEVNVTAFIADQTPPPQGAHRTTFLNQDTPIFKGPEKIAQKLNYPVVYVYVKRIKRGYYEMFAEVLVADPSAAEEGEISELHTKRLEADIISQPETWLWSHRRWKHKKP